MRAYLSLATGTIGSWLRQIVPIRANLDTSELLEGRYRLEGLIGRGGMAEVFRAKDLRLERQVAVKLIRQAPFSDLRRFSSEARTLASSLASEPRTSARQRERHGAGVARNGAPRCPDAGRPCRPACSFG